MPGSTAAGMAEKNASKAASPPAEVPIPTTGKPVSVVSAFFVCPGLLFLPRLLTPVTVFSFFSAELFLAFMFCTPQGEVNRAPFD